MKIDRRGLFHAVAERRWVMEPRALVAAAEVFINVHPRPDAPALSAAEGSDRSDALDYDRRGYYLAEGVAVIEVAGTMLKNVPYSYSGEAVSTVWLRQVFARALDDPLARAILFLVDSPGGEVAGTQELCDDLFAARGRKPIHAHVSDLCASGSYWLASQCESISANRTAVVGSIGVYGVLEDWSAAYEEAGVKVHLITSGEHKGVGVEGVAITPEQLAPIQEQVDGLADMFRDAVARGRSLSAEHVKTLATGRVWLAADALTNRLIDRIENSEDALARVALSSSGSSARMESPGASPSAKGDFPMLKLFRSKGPSGQTQAQETPPEAPPAATTGGIQVNLSPPEAVAAGAQWRVDAGELQPSGATVNGLAVGPHTVDYSEVAGWTAPASQEVQVEADAVTIVEAAYTAVEAAPAEPAPAAPAALSLAEFNELCEVIGPTAAHAAVKSALTVQQALSAEITRLKAEVETHKQFIAKQGGLGEDKPLAVAAAEANGKPTGPLPSPLGEKLARVAAAFRKQLNKK